MQLSTELEIPQAKRSVCECHRFNKSSDALNYISKPITSEIAINDFFLLLASSMERILQFWKYSSRTTNLFQSALLTTRPIYERYLYDGTYTFIFTIPTKNDDDTWLSPLLRRVASKHVLTLAKGKQYQRWSENPTVINDPRRYIILGSLQSMNFATSMKSTSRRCVKKVCKIRSRNHHLIGRREDEWEASV